MFAELCALPADDEPSREESGARIEAVPKRQPWARADVEMWLKVGFRAMREVPICAPTIHDNTMCSVSTRHPSATFDIVAFAATVLGRRSLECNIVLTWARTMAAPAGHADCSISEFCRTASPKISRATFDRKRIAACERIATAKNAADAGAR
ncbi:hypothetical protein ACLBYG_22015 [Methylobacterium sp. D53M]